MRRQNDCDMSKPEEHAAWAVAGLVMSSGDVLSMHERDAEAISTQLWQAGFRFHPRRQTHGFIGAPSLGGGVWAPLAEAEAVAAEMSVPDISGLSLDQKTHLMKQLKEMGFGSHDEPPTRAEGAEVIE